MTEEHTHVDMGKARLDQAAPGREWLAGLMGEAESATSQMPVTRDVWVIDFPYAKTPISPNGAHGNPYAHAKAVKAVRSVAHRLAEHAGIPHLGRAEVQLTWYVLTNARRDPINLNLTLKAMVDGLVDAGITTDDTPNLVHTKEPLIVRVDKMRHREAWMELVISRWSGLTTTSETPIGKASS
jgi:crossover junction endodeoxyribonuclease RusA